MSKKLILTLLLFIFALAPVYASAQVSEPIFPGTTEGTGTDFTITDSEYLNITLNSSEEISLRMESVPEMVTMMIGESLTSTSTQITLSGFAPLTTYYKYEDSYRNLTEVATDQSGAFSYTQDFTSPHLIFIQPRKSTKFIADNATGGDCATIGTWDVPTKTCTLTQDVFETIQIDSNGVTLDGNGYTITGTYWFWCLGC